MTLPVTGTAPVAQAECTSCTVPTPHADQLCDFCRSYRPPAGHQHRCTHCGDDQAVPCSYVPPATADQRLTDAVNHAHLAHGDITEVLQQLPADTSMWATVDLVRASRHLRAAAALIEKAAAAVEVTQ